jgi:GrpB-like predicted nucleotidyltransferase (UPF0157 family)
MTPNATDEDSLIRNAIREGVCMHAYDAAWPVSFRQEQTRLQALFPGAFRDIQHIGSTAVPGLTAKPIIDMMAGVDSMAAVEALVDPLRLTADYVYVPEQNLMLPERRWLLRQRHGHRTHHLHLVEFEGAEWFRLLRFRDALLHDPALAERYMRLKSELVDRFGDDRDRYTRSKSDFVQEVLGAR